MYATRLRLLLAGAALCALSAEVGCASVPEGFEERAFRYGGSERRYLLHTPPGYRPDGPERFPLVLALHGGGGTAEGLAAAGGASLRRAADRHRMLLVCPQGIDRRWNDGREEIFRRLLGPDAPRHDDAGFLVALSRELVRTHAVDPARVYATGISNGGFMSLRLAVEHSDVFAAVAPVTATLSVALAGTRPLRPVSVLFVNGTEDPLVPYEGGHVRLFRRGRSRGRVLSTDASLAFFRRRAGLEGPPTEEALPDRDPTDGARATRLLWSGGEEGCEVALLRVEGGGHTWPGGDQYLPERLVGRVCRDFDASEEILAFFARHRLQAP